MMRASQRMSSIGLGLLRLQRGGGDKRRADGMHRVQDAAGDAEELSGELADSFGSSGLAQLAQSVALHGTR